MYPVSAAFLDAARSSARVQVMADVSKAGQRLYSDLPVIGGSLTIDAGQITRRRVSLSIAPKLRDGVYGERDALPRAWSDPLGHYGQEITLRWGLTYPNGLTEWIPLGVFRVESARGSLLSQSGVEVVGVSREAWVADDRFPSPRTVSGSSAQRLISSLITETLPHAEVVMLASGDRRILPTLFERDRWESITQLATSIGATVSCDPLGRFAIADVPTAESAPVWRIAEGELLISADTGSSREQIYNKVVLTADNPSSGQDPVTGTATDTGPTSPTRWGDPDVGAYGRVTKFMALPTVMTKAVADRAARAELARSVGAATIIDSSSVPNPALDGLDVIDIVIGDEIHRHSIDSIRMDLRAGGDFRLSTRDLGVI